MPVSQTRDALSTARRPAMAGYPDKEHFAAGIKQALKHYARPDRLQDTPLLESAMVMDACGPGADAALRVAVLRELISRYVIALNEAPKTALYQRVLHATYLRPAANQSAAAQDLGLAFSSYRRHLANAIRLLTTHLWTAELRLREQNLVQKVNSRSD